MAPSSPTPSSSGPSPSGPSSSGPSSSGPSSSSPSSFDPSRASVSIRQERAGDVEEISSVVAAAFTLAEHSAPPTHPGGPPGEVDLLTALRSDAGWLPEFSLVACAEEQVIGHVVCTRARVEGAPVLGLGPLSVRPDHQREGVGGALVREVLSQAERAGESLVALLGDPAYYRRFGFVPAHEVGVDSPEPAWGDYFQALPLGAGGVPTGRFAYAEPFNNV